MYIISVYCIAVEIFWFYCGMTGRPLFGTAVFSEVGNSHTHTELILVILNIVRLAGKYTARKMACCFRRYSSCVKNLALR